MAINPQQGFPNLSAPIANLTNGGRLMQPWYNFFITLWNRTGGSQNTSSPATVNTTQGTILTAAQLTSPIIVRSGPTAPFTDTFDTAANYIAAVGTNAYIGQSLSLRIINTTAYAETLNSGTGFTFVGNFTIPANSSYAFTFIINAIRPTAKVTVYA